MRAPKKKDAPGPHTSICGPGLGLDVRPVQDPSSYCTLTDSVSDRVSDSVTAVNGSSFTDSAID